MSTFEICDLFREYGNFKATKEYATGFWVHLELEDEETIQKVTKKALKKHSRHLRCVKNHKDVSKYYLNNI